MLKSRLHKRLKPFFRRWGSALLIGGLVYSCASIGHLEGGPKDEMPPRFLTSTPLPGELQVTKKKFSIVFDEYLKLDKPGEKIVFSPPQIQQPEVKASGKRIIVSLQDTLIDNTTYTIDFGDAIQDNNEGNPLEGFTYTFSTGDHLDSLAILGTVLNAADLEPVKGMLVGLHSNMADSAFTTLPFDRVGLTDSRGQFSIRGVSPGEYRIFALQDADQNYMYSQPTEAIAFNDTLIIPSAEMSVRQDTMWLDSLTVDTIFEESYTHFMPDNVLLRCFKETKYSQRLLKTERLVPYKLSFYFTAPADTLPLIEGLNFDPKDAFIVEYPTGRIDTLNYWIKDTLLYQLDTLRMKLSYLYTDTLDQLVPRTDTLDIISRLSYQRYKEREQEAAEQELKAQEKQNKRKSKKKDTQEKPKNKSLSVNVYAPNSLDAYDYLSFTFEEPVVNINDTAFHVRHKVDTLWYDIPFDFQQDNIEVKQYNIYADWAFGESYQLEVDTLAFQGLLGLSTDPIKKEFKVKMPEEYGQIFFNITGADSIAFVELLDTQDKVVRTVSVSPTGRADFFYLNPGKYCARLINDTNGNGIWDTGNYAEKRQPERVYYYPQQLELKANFDLLQDWNILALPLDKQKPDAIKKQKPDDKKKR